MALIFLASAQPKAVLPDYGDQDWLVKKTGHVVIYAGLAWTYLWGLTGGQRLKWRTAALAVGLAALYGASDELHQSFVPGRGATVIDVGIDTVGAALGTVLWAVWGRWRAAITTRNLRGL